MMQNLEIIHIVTKSRVFMNGQVEEKRICAKAFISIYGISKNNLEYLQKGLKNYQTTH